MLKINKKINFYLHHDAISCISIIYIKKVSTANSFVVLIEPLNVGNIHLPRY